MKIQPYIEKLNSSKEFKEFTKKYNDAFLVAGFFVIDLETGKNIHQIDFYIPSDKKFAAFSLDEEIRLQLMDTMTDKVPEKLDITTKIDLDALHGILEDEMKNRSITEEIKKIIAVIQNFKGKKVWNVNCVLSGMEILKAHVDDETQTVLKMEMQSLTDIMKKIPSEQIQQLQKSQKQGENPEGKKGDAEEEIKKLEELEKNIQKEKDRLKKEVVKEKKPAKK
jgi:hypothetical protein